MLGPNSNYGVAGDYGWVEFDNRECVTLFDGLKQAVGKDVQVNQLDGCDWWSQKDDGIAAAVELARKAILPLWQSVRVVFGWVGARKERT